MRSLLAPIVLPLAALIAALVRWLAQGSGNVWTAFDKRFYIPDVDLGWRISVQHPIWLGLEVCAVIAAIAIGLAIGAWLVRRRETTVGRRARVLRGAMWVVATVPLAVPLAAFASGPGAAGGRDTLPLDAPIALVDGVTGALDLPAGRYEIIAHEGTSITANLSAGQERFDARFTGDIRGTWQGDPGALASPMTAVVSVAASSVDTGIDERSKHAREGYLRAATYPRITFALDALDAARPTSERVIGFRGHGTLGLIGKAHPVAVTGTIAKLDGDAVTRLGLTGAIMRVQADFSLAIRETALAPDAADFDGDRIPIHVSLVLRHTGD